MIMLIEIMMMLVVIMPEEVGGALEINESDWWSKWKSSYSICIDNKSTVAKSPYIWNWNFEKIIRSSWRRWISQWHTLPSLTLQLKPQFWQSLQLTSSSSFPFLEIIITRNNHGQVDFATKPQFWRTLHPPIKEKLGELLVIVFIIIIIIKIMMMMMMMMAYTQNSYGGYSYS